MDLNKLMEQARKMQNDLGKIEDELNEKIYEGKTGSGNEGVIVRISGSNEVQQIIIGDDLMNPDDKELLQDMILIAANNAIEAAKNEREEKLGAATSGLNIPGL